MEELTKLISRAAFNYIKKNPKKGKEFEFWY